jgi:HEAT repeat protein
LAVPSSVPAVNPRLGILVPATAEPARSEPATEPRPEPPRVQPPFQARPRGLTTLVTDIVSKVVSKTQASDTRAPGTELTVIALTLGMIALAVGWPLQQGWLALALSGLGLALAGVMVGALAWRKAAGLALPVTALAINLQGLILAIVFCATDHSSGTPSDGSYPPLAGLSRGLSSNDPAARAQAIADYSGLLQHIGEALNELLPHLRDPDAEVRAAAAAALGHMGTHARIAYPTLDQLSRTDPHEAVRRNSRAALFKVGRPSLSDKTELVRLLDSPRPILRAAAAQALGTLGADAWGSSQPLEKLLADNDPEVKVSAAQAWWRIRRKQTKDLVSILVNGLENRGNAVPVRGQAAAALGDMRSLPPQAIDALASALVNGEPGLRIQAAFALGALKRDEAAKKAVESLRNALKDQEILVKLVAAHTLWTLDKKTEGLPILIDALHHRDADIRWTAAAALGEFGKEGKPAVLELARRVCSGEIDGEVRRQAARALYLIGKDAVEAVPALLDALSHEDSRTRADAAKALSGIGPKAAEAIPRLRRIMHDDTEAEPRLFAAWALWEIERNEKEVLPVLSKLLLDKNLPALRKYAAAGLGVMREKAAAAVPDLHQVFKEEDTELRMAAAEALGDIGGSLARVTYPTLKEIAGDEQQNGQLRLAAGEAIGKIGVPTRADVPAFIGALDATYPEGFRVNAALSLMFLKRQAKDAVDILSKSLTDPAPAVRMAAAYALDAMGADAAPAVPDLQKALSHPDKAFCAVAAKVLGNIGPAAKGAVPDLQTILVNRESSLDLRLNAAAALSALSVEAIGLVPVLREGLGAKDVNLAIQAARTLGKIGAGSKASNVQLRHALKAEAVPKLRAALVRKKEADDAEEAEEETGPRDNLRREVITALGELGYAARDALPELVRALDEPEPEFLVQTVDAIGKIAAAESAVDKRDVRSKAAYSSLSYFDKSPSEPVQKAVAAALETIGEPVAADARVLFKILEDKELPVFYRMRAGQVIGIIRWEEITRWDEGDGPELLATAKHLAAVVRDERDQADQAIRATAIEALGDLGAGARKEYAALVDALAGTRVEIQALAARALGGIFAGGDLNPPAEVVEQLTIAMSSSDRNVAAKAAAALKKIKKK